MKNILIILIAMFFSGCISEPLPKKKVYFAPNDTNQMNIKQNNKQILNKELDSH